MISKDEAHKKAELAMDRDPRRSRYGYLSGGSFVLDATRIFQWFDSKEDLCSHILNVDLVNFDLDPDEIKVIKAEVKSTLGSNDLWALNEETLLELNKKINAVMEIDWWGEFEELVQGGTDFSRNLIAGFRDEEDDEAGKEPIRKSEESEFVEYIRDAFI